MKHVLNLCFISNPNSTHTQRWVNWFAQRGHRVCLIADVLQEEPWKDIEVHNLPARFNLPVIKYFVWLIWIRSFLKSWGKGILHAHRVSGAGWLAAFTGFHPCVITPWGSDLYQQPNRSLIAKWLAHKVLKSADLVTADSRDLRDLAVQFGANPDHSHLIQWGVDLKSFYPKDNSPEVRISLGIDKSAPVVLSPRAVNPIYNLDTIIECIPHVTSVHPEAIFLFRDYNTDARYKISLNRKIQDLGVERSIRWLGRVEPWELIADTYYAAQIAVSLASTDGTPTSVLEAMACGTAIIAGDIPSLREWITNGENGLLVPLRDPAALARAINELIADTSKCKLFRERNLESIRTRADHEIEMQKMEELYYSLLGQP